MYSLNLGVKGSRERNWDESVAQGGAVLNWAPAFAQEWQHALGVGTRVGTGFGRGYTCWHGSGHRRVGADVGRAIVFPGEGISSVPSKMSTWSTCN